MRVATVRCFSQHPEDDAWRALKGWAEPRGLLKDPNRYPVFGFNNPGPSPGRKEYGYEFWIRVDGDLKPEEPLKVKQFPGGRYAVMTCRGFPNPVAWKRLSGWLKTSVYRWRDTHELEKVQSPLAPEAEMVFDLYLPIED